MHSTNGKSIDLPEVIAVAMEQGASDIHFSPGKRIKLRVDGSLVDYEGSPVVGRTDTQCFFEDYLSKGEQGKYDQRKSYDTSIQIESTRARLHFYETMEGVCMSCRIVPLIPRKMDELLIPPVVRGWIEQKGIVIVSGLANMGKTTTLSSIVHYLNTTRSEKIVILEDPIEYVHRDMKSSIFQREIGQHSPSYADALRDISREDTNTVIVGEVRTAAAMDAVFGMAENGLKVFTSVHATGALETLEKIISLFQPADYDRVHKRLSWNLVGILNQHLLPRKKPGRVLACEILTASSDKVKTLLREGKIYQLNTYLDPGDGETMCSLAKYQQMLRQKCLL
ncbi:MAG: Flp pilus assembly complex ATPase component TadA [Alphaproteobacteria bacterium]|uniref:Flp pilus assembly complex ATPase component TadA n=1 Tax=Candidatus Nitrobium versatile TaxID=2884831 RepID=A0A953M272_9BACT|nr:Flp pilus assembly complex ATPase component TadA [Candidatus Nitrobium versatile]